MSNRRVAMLTAGALLAIAGCAAPEPGVAGDVAAPGDAGVHGRRSRAPSDRDRFGPEGSRQSAEASQPTRLPPPLASREAGFLPDEHLFLEAKAGALAGEKAGLVLASEDFDDLVRSLDESMATDRDAADMATFYEQQIERQLPENSALGDLACGMSVCIGSVRDSAAGSAGEAWVLEFTQSPDTPHHSFIYAQVALDPSNVETRFVISTDPAFGGITIPAPGGGMD
jgi:hypothetical protein